MNINYHDFYDTVIKDREDKEILVDFGKNYINFDGFITPNHYIGRKKDNERLRYRNLYLTKERIKISDKSFQTFYPI